MGVIIPPYLQEFVMRVDKAGHLICVHGAVVTNCKVCMGVIAARAARGRS